MTSAFGGQHSIQLSYGCVIVANTRNTVRITDFADKAKEKAMPFVRQTSGKENTCGAPCASAGSYPAAPDEHMATVGVSMESCIRKRRRKDRRR